LDEVPSLGEIAPVAVAHLDAARITGCVVARGSNRGRGATVTPDRLLGANPYGHPRHNDIEPSDCPTPISGDLYARGHKRICAAMCVLTSVLRAVLARRSGLRPRAQIGGSESSSSVWSSNETERCDRTEQ
jgi:hypothetical protein